MITYLKCGGIVSRSTLNQGVTFCLKMGYCSVCSFFCCNTTPLETLQSFVRFSLSESSFLKGQVATMMTLVEINHGHCIKRLFCAVDMGCAHFPHPLLPYAQLLYSRLAPLPPFSSLCMSSESVTCLKQSRPLPWKQQLD